MRLTAAARGRTLWKMKAIRVHQFGGPEVLRWEEVPDPKPGPAQVLIRTRAVGVNPVDTYLRGGMNPKLPLPYTPGTDAVGEVIAGALPAGTRLYTSKCVTGAYAELVLCDVSDTHPVPERLSFVQGAGINVPFATAWRGLFQRAKAEAGETILVHGASGGVGTAAVQMARNAGLHIIGTAGTAEGEALLRKLGAHHVVNHRKPDYLTDIMALTQGRGVDVILEMLANVNLGKDLALLAPRGRVVVIGNRGPVEINAREGMMREADIRCMSLFNATPKELASIHAALGAGLANGTLVPVIAREMPLAEAAKAHEAVMQPGAQGKIVLVA